MMLYDANCRMDFKDFADQQPPTFIVFLLIFELTCTKHEWNLHHSAPTP